MRVLVTGATGYLGTRVVARLMASGHEVIGMARPGREAALPPGCAAALGDVRDPGSLRRALRGCEALVHLAALVRVWTRDAREFDRVNVEGLVATLRAAEEAAVRRVVYTSSIVVLGPTDGAIRDEAFERADFAFHTDYERSKWIADRVARDRAAAGQPIVFVYPGVVYGHGAGTEGNLLDGTLRDYLAGRLRTRLGRSDLRICYAYVEDVAEGHRLALERGAPGPGYVLGGDNATLQELFAHLEAITGIEPPRRVVPYWVAETIGRLLRARARLTGIPPVITDGVVATFRHEWAYSSERARRELGYRPTPLRDGLTRTIEALRREMGRPATAGEPPKPGSRPEAGA